MTSSGPFSSVAYANSTTESSPRTTIGLVTEGLRGTMGTCTFLLSTRSTATAPGRSLKTPAPAISSSLPQKDL